MFKVWEGEEFSEKITSNYNNTAVFDKHKNILIIGGTMLFEYGSRRSRRSRVKFGIVTRKTNRLSRLN